MSETYNYWIRAGVITLILACAAGMTAAFGASSAESPCLGRVTAGSSSVQSCPQLYFPFDLQEIQIIDVITALEGEQRFVCCRDLISGIKCDCKGESEYMIHHVMDHVLSAAKAELAKTSLKEHRDNEHNNNRKST